MKIIRVFVEFFTGHDFVENYYKRFLQPQRERLRALGIQESDIDRLWHYALHMAELSSGYFPPGMFLREYADRLEAGDRVEDILP